MNCELKKIIIEDFTDDFNAKETIYLITADVYADGIILGNVHESVSQEFIYREGMGKDFQGWKVDKSGDSAFGVGNNKHIFKNLDDDVICDLEEKVIELLQLEIDKNLNIGFLNMSN